MKIKVILLLLLTILIIIFAIQNAEIVTLRLWFWVVDIPRAMLIVICIAIGIIFGLFLAGSKEKE